MRNLRCYPEKCKIAKMHICTDAQMHLCKIGLGLISIPIFVRLFHPTLPSIECFNVRSQ